jgi:type IV secretory pathway VirJ component
MKKDTRNFVLTMVSIPAILAAASGVHAFAVPSVEQEVAEIVEVPVEAPIVGTTTVAEPAKKPAVLTPVVKKPVTPVVTAPAPVVVTPSPVVTKPKLTPVKTVVVTPKRSRTTRAS